MFTTLIVQPIFNLLALIYGLLPGHNFGLAIILFTIIVRLLMWPLVKKQLHQVKLMRKIQPELKKVKAAAKGDKRKESMLMMELYKERGINPFSSLGVLILQIPILFGLYLGLQKVIKDPSQIETFSYPFIQGLSWMKELASNVHLFDATLFGVVDLKRAALGPSGVYWPAMVIVLGSAVAQFYQSKQLSPTTKDSRKVRDILKAAGKGEQADQGELNAAMGRNMRFILPVLILLFTVNIPSALSLYWLVSGITALIQQGVVLREDVNEMEAEVNAKGPKAKDREKAALEAEIVATPKKTSSTSKAKARKKRRK